MTYWLHRCAYMGGHTILDREHRLTIGFSACAKDENMALAVKQKDGNAFDKNYRMIYEGNILRARCNRLKILEWVGRRIEEEIQMGA